jgi:LytS/YehU family sensor histidine kinase
MSTYSFVFSNNPRFRISRHILFWLVWVIFYTIVYSQRAGAALIGFRPFLLYSFFELVISLPVFLFYAYVVIYLLLPGFLMKGKYVRFMLFLIVSLFAALAMNHYVNILFVNPLRQVFALSPYKVSLSSAMLWMVNDMNMPAGIAATIKLLKIWYVKQQEIDLLKAEKLQVEFKAVEGQTQPNFIPNILSKIYSYSLVSSPKTPEMIQKLQHILVYFMNECNEPQVSLEREIQIIRDFLQLEKLTAGDKLHITTDFSGDMRNRKIAPYILFPMIENNFRQISDNIIDKQWINIQLAIENNQLWMKMSNSKPIETSNLLSYETSTLQNIKKRLELLYPGSYKLKMVIEPEIFYINLEMQLKGALG